MKARLILSDGAYFEGLSLGAMGTNIGEVVFNTAMMGYQEILTDPSYHFQLVTMTYPQIGNYGVNPKDFESRRIYAAGLIIREYSPAEVKKAITGSGRADKRQVARLVCRELSILREGLSEDTTDALAVALCYAHRRRMERLLEDRAADR